MKILRIVIPCLILALILVSCKSNHNTSLKSKIGKECVVRFKHNILGQASQLAAAPVTDNFNGANLSIIGTLKGIDREAIYLNVGNLDYWIPKDNILMIQTDNQPVGK